MTKAAPLTDPTLHLTVTHEKWTMVDGVDAGHEGRHTAATLRLEAGVDIRVVSEQLGHSKTAITQDLYQHVRRAVLDQATDKVVTLLARGPRKDTRRRPAAAEATG